MPMTRDPYTLDALFVFGQLVGPVLISAAMAMLVWLLLQPSDRVWRIAGLLTIAVGVDTMLIVLSADPFPNYGWVYVLCAMSATWGFLIGSLRWRSLQDAERLHDEVLAPLAD